MRKYEQTFLLYKDSEKHEKLRSLYNIMQKKHLNTIEKWENASTILTVVTKLIYYISRNSFVTHTFCLLHSFEVSEWCGFVIVYFI